MAYWAKSLSVGVESIDAQHLEFLELCDRYGTAAGAARAVIADAIMRHTVEHFVHEEAVLVECGYHLAKPGDFLLHRHEHRRLKRRIVDLCLHQGPVDSLVAALLEHLLRHDLRYAEFMRSSVAGGVRA